MSKKSSSHHYHRTFIIMVGFAFVLSICFALIFNILFDQMDTMNYQVLRMEKRIQKINDNLGIVMMEEDEEVLPPKLIVNEETQHDQAWLKRDIPEIGVKFFYPADYIVSGDDTLLYVSPKPKVSDETPLPVVVLKNIPNRSTLSLDAFIRGYYKGKAYDQLEEKSLNGINARKVKFEEVNDTYSTCGSYVLEVNESFLEVSPYECHEWEHFDAFIESFTKR